LTALSCNTANIQSSYKYEPFKNTQHKQKDSSGVYGATEDNKRQTHRQSGWAPLHPDQSAIHLNQCSPIFMPDALPAATHPIYPGLGQAQEYAGLHTPMAWFRSIL